MTFKGIKDFWGPILSDPIGVIKGIKELFKWAKTGDEVTTPKEEKENAENND